MNPTVVVAEPISLPFDSARTVLAKLDAEIATSATSQAVVTANSLVEASAPHWNWFDSDGDVRVVVGDLEEEAQRLTIQIEWTGAKSGRLLTGLSGALTLAQSDEVSSQLTFVGAHQRLDEVAQADQLLGNQVMQAIARSFLAAAAVDLVSRATEAATKLGTED